MISSRNSFTRFLLSNFVGMFPLLCDVVLVVGLLFILILAVVEVVCCFDVVVELLFISILAVVEIVC